VTQNLKISQQKIEGAQTDHQGKTVRGRSLFELLLIWKKDIYMGKFWDVAN
jgi:hypothetical protein